MSEIHSRVVTNKDGTRTLLTRIKLNDSTNGETGWINLLDSRQQIKKMHRLKVEIACMALRIFGSQIKAADMLGINRNTFRGLLPKEERPGKGGRSPLPQRAAL